MNNLESKLLKCASILFLFIMSIHSYAIEVPEDKAKLVATNYLRYLTNQSLKRSGELVKLVYTSKQPTSKRAVSAPLFYVFNQVQGSGFVIVSGDDNIKPILGYSLESNFDETNLSPQVAYWLSEYEKQIAFAVESNVQNIAEKQQWEFISSNQIAVKRGTTAVKPLLKTTWDQGTFYNDSCPFDNTAKKRVPVGCVATAMAQTMKYWGYPNKGVSSTSYTHTTYGLLKASFGNTTYNWAAMPNKVSSSNTEVARLMYHCGVALNMMYGPDGSGSWATYDARYAKSANMHLSLIDYFQYDNTSISSIFKRDFTDQAWQDKLKTELNQARVIVYCGNDGTGKSGHCFVFDGYDLNDFFHIDWGWSGAFNGYFTITNLVPNGTGTGGGSGNYSSNQEAVIGIRPKVSQVPVAGFSTSTNFTSVGQVINLVDESTNYPNAWSWTISPNNATFVNGTANTSKFPEVIFSTPGKYTITLTSTNSKGANTVSKTNYIIVNPALTKQVCDTLTNFLSTEKKTYVPIKGGGSLAGHISGLIGFAELYTNYGSYTHISGALLDFARAETKNTTSTIKVNVYQNNNGAPGTILSSKLIKISDIKNDVANKVETKVLFDNPIAITGQFFIGIETTNAPGDSVGLYTTSTSGVTTNTGFIKFSSDNSWCTYEKCWSALKIHLKVLPLVATLPTPNFVINTSPTTINTNVDIDASSSKDAYAYNWTINGATTTSSNYYKETISYKTPGTYDIKLDAIGGCGSTSSITKQIKVNGLCTTAPSTPGSITGTTNICVGQTNTTYSVAPVNDATSYAWTLPSGFTGTSSTNTISVTAPNTVQSGDIKVQAFNSCGTSVASTLTLFSIQKTLPSFTAVDPICSGDVLNALPSLSTNGISGIWSPSLDNTKTTDYLFTPTQGQCATAGTIKITVNSKIIPSFTAVDPICTGATLTALPSLSTNGISGIWSPSLDNTKTTDYLFTPTQGQCADKGTIKIIVNSKITPSFTAVDPICTGSILNALPTSSTNSISGTWSPALDNTKTTRYTFTPTQDQCADTTSIIISVLSTPVTPTFESVSPICNGEKLLSLPTTSLNKIAGTWSPALDNTKTTDYLFTPAQGQCATTGAMKITVNTKITPSFTAVNPICAGANLNALPTASLDKIAGTWSPALDNTKTTTYTFTPNKGICANITMLSVQIDSIPNPGILSISGVVCQGKTASIKSSVNGGVWTSNDNGIATVDINGNVTFVSEGTATITYTRSTNSCNAKASKSFAIGKCLELITLDNQNINIFPNPTQDKLHLQLNSDSFVKYELISPVGNVLLSNLLIDKNTTIDVSEYAAGLYLIRVFDVQNKVSHLYFNKN